MHAAEQHTILTIVDIPTDYDKGTFTFGIYILAISAGCHVIVTRLSRTDVESEKAAKSRKALIMSETALNCMQLIVPVLFLAVEAVLPHELDALFDRVICMIAVSLATFRLKMTGVLQRINMYLARIAVQDQTVASAASADLYLRMHVKKSESGPKSRPLRTWMYIFCFWLLVLPMVGGSLSPFLLPDLIVVPGIPPFSVLLTVSMSNVVYSMIGGKHERRAHYLLWSAWPYYMMLVNLKVFCAPFSSHLSYITLLFINAYDVIFTYTMEFSFAQGMVNRFVGTIVTCYFVRDSLATMQFAHGYSRWDILTASLNEKSSNALNVYMFASIATYLATSLLALLLHLYSHYTTFVKLRKSLFQQ